jgi:hypothetical protein
VSSLVPCFLCWDHGWQLGANQCDHGNTRAGCVLHSLGSLCGRRSSPSLRQTLGFLVARKSALLFGPASHRSLPGTGFALFGRELLGAGVPTSSSKFNRVGLFLFCQSALPVSQVSHGRCVPASILNLTMRACTHNILCCMQPKSGYQEAKMAKKDVPTESDNSVTASSPERPLKPLGT